MLGKTFWTLAAMVAWITVGPVFSGYAISDPPANFLVAITNMMSLPNLAYEEIDQDRHLGDGSSYVEWKHSSGKTFYRMRRNGSEWMDKEMIHLFDGTANYTLFSDVALRDEEPRTGFPGMPGIKYLAAAQNALPVPDEFQGVPCWRYEWLCEHVFMRFTGGTPNLDRQSVIRNDFIDRATGWWIGYTMTNTEGPFVRSTRLDLIRTNELPDEIFATPKPPLRVRPHTSEIYQEEVVKRMTALGLIKKSAVNFTDGAGLLGMLGQRYHLPLNRILFCAGLGAVGGFITLLILERRRKKRS